MALRPTYLAFSNNPNEFSVFVRAHGEELAPGVFLVQGHDTLAVVRNFAKVGGFTVFTIEVSVADIATHK